MRVLLMLLAAVVPAFSCSCISPTVCDLLNSPTLFIGEVIDGGVASLREDPWYSSSTRVRFRVLERFRGVANDVDVVEVLTDPTFGMCAANPYRPGRKYLVSPRLGEGKLHDGGCFSGRDIEWIPDQVSQIRDHFSGTTKFAVHGRVMNGLRGERAMPAAPVVTTVDGRQYSAVSGDNGWYTLSLPGPGRYELRVAQAPFTVRPEVVMLRGNCAVSDFYLVTNNTISGMVWDGKGHAVKGKVGLVDVDRLRSAPEEALIDSEYAEEKGQRYEFRNVPPGRYLLVSNPEGPQFDDARYESTYYPLDSPRSAAQVIEIGSAAVHLTGKDLVIGRPASFREVFVRVRFPDGAPMKTAAIRITGEPLEEGGVPWIAWRNNDMATFQAPVNRKLRIEVKDWHRRDLGKPYVAIHEAGAGPIKQDFVVMP